MAGSACVKERRDPPGLNQKHSTKDIATLFPNLMDIADAALRDKVASVRNEALTTGCGGKGWTFDQNRGIPFALLAGKIDLRFVEHLNSCCKRCIAITGVVREVFGARVPVNLNDLIAGSLLADVGKMLDLIRTPAGSWSRAMRRHAAAPVQRR